MPVPAMQDMAQENDGFSAGDNLEGRKMPPQMPDNMQMDMKMEQLPENMQTNRMPKNMPVESTTENSAEQYGLLVISMLLLAAGFVFVCFYKRKNY